MTPATTFGFAQIVPVSVVADSFDSFTFAAALYFASLISSACSLILSTRLPAAFSWIRPMKVLISLLGFLGPAVYDRFSIVKEEPVASCSLSIFRGSRIAHCLQCRFFIPTVRDYYAPTSPCSERSLYLVFSSASKPGFFY